jgi:hypothetical protein
MVHSVLQSNKYMIVKICIPIYNRQSYRSSIKIKVKVKVKVMLQQTVSRPVCLHIKHPPGAQDQICITVIQLQVCWCGAPYMMRGWVCHLQLLLALTSTVILGSQSCKVHDHILLIRDSSNVKGPRKWVAQLYPQALGSFFVTSYNSLSQGVYIYEPASTQERNSVWTAQTRCV